MTDSRSTDFPLNLWHISRPRFWIYLFGPYIVGLLIGAGQLSALHDWRVPIFGGFFLFPANLFLYGVNDIHDYETDARNRKKEGYESFVAPSQQRRLRRAIALWTLPFVVLTLFTTNILAIAAAAGFIFFSHQYSAPPIRAKARPIVDSMFNVLYVFPAFFAYFLTGGRHFAPDMVVAAWCWTMAMHAYSAVPDISADRQAGLDTIATRFGFQSTLEGCLALYLAAAALSFSALGALSILLGALYITMMLISLRAGDEERLLQVYRVFPLLNTLAGFCLFWWIALHKF